MTFIKLMILGLTTISLLGSCTLFLPSPTNQQIVDAVKVSNEKESILLELNWDDLKVPNRFNGSAKAILWVFDKSLFD